MQLLGGEEDEEEWCEGKNDRRLWLCELPRREEGQLAEGSGWVQVEGLRGTRAKMSVLLSSSWGTREAV